MPVPFLKKMVNSSPNSLPWLSKKHLPQAVDVAQWSSACHSRMHKALGSVPSTKEEKRQSPISLSLQSQPTFFGVTELIPNPPIFLQRKHKEAALKMKLSLHLQHCPGDMEVLRYCLYGALWRSFHLFHRTTTFLDGAFCREDNRWPRQIMNMDTLHML